MLADAILADVRNLIKKITWEEGRMPPKPLEATKDITFARNLALHPLIEYSILMTCKILNHEVSG